MYAAYFLKYGDSKDGRSSDSDIARCEMSMWATTSLYDKQASAFERESKQARLSVGMVEE